MTQRLAVGVGANVGDPLAALRGAVARIAAHPGVRGAVVSSLFRTAPVGGVEQPDFLNAVLVADTDLGPDDLIALAEGVEREFGRTREVRWGPRTLDVDIIAMDGEVLDDPDLTLPHPRAHERAFVCVPWLDVEPGAALPQGPIGSLDLDRSGVVRRSDLALALPADRAR